MKLSPLKRTVGFRYQHVSLKITPKAPTSCKLLMFYVARYRAIFLRDQTANMNCFKLPRTCTISLNTLRSVYCAAAVQQAHDHKASEQPQIPYGCKTSNKRSMHSTVLCWFNCLFNLFIYQPSDLGEFKPIKPPSEIYLQCIPVLLIHLGRSAAGYKLEL